MKSKKILLLLIGLSLLTACSTHKTAELSSKSYEISELRKFFEVYKPLESNISYSGLAGKTQYMDAKEKFPESTESVNQNGEAYSVYEVVEGGRYYVFWQRGESVGETLYIDRLRTKEDFNTITVGSTLEEVMQIDPNVRLLVASSALPRTRSYLDDGGVLDLIYSLGSDGVYKVVEIQELLGDSTRRVNMDDLP